ncbi:hypothetical protein Avbf_10831 [Armadillidium vulgare]|nr:hypothetical protein Avbf_10831 [Armadillidium vulgare]
MRLYSPNLQLTLNTLKKSFVTHHCKLIYIEQYSFGTFNSNLLFYFKFTSSSVSSECIPQVESFGQEKDLHFVVFSNWQERGLLILEVS